MIGKNFGWCQPPPPSLNPVFALVSKDCIYLETLETSLSLFLKRQMFVRQQ